MRQDRSGRASAGWAAIGLAVAFSTSGGCSSLQTGDDWSLSKALDFDLRRKIPWTTAAEKEAKKAGKLIAIWTDATLHQEGAPSMRGFGGRLMFYPVKGGEAVEVDGELTVYAYVEDGGVPRSEQPDRKFVFTSEQLAKVQSKTNLGHSYSVWLPWGPVDGETVHMSLIARFQPKDGQAIVGEQTKNLLPGKDDPRDRAKEMAAARAAQPNPPSAGQTLQNQLLQAQALQNAAPQNAGPPNPLGGQTSYLPAGGAPGAFPQAAPTYPSPAATAYPNPSTPLPYEAAAAPAGWPASPLQEVRPVSLQTLGNESPAVGSATRMQTSTYTLSRGLPPGPAPQAAFPSGPQPQLPPAAYGNGHPPPQTGGYPQPAAPLPGSNPAAGAQPVLAWGSPAAVNPAAVNPSDAPSGWNAGPQGAPAAAGWGRNASASIGGGDDSPSAAANAWRRDRTVGAPIPNVTRPKPIWRNP